MLQNEEEILHRVKEIFSTSFEVDADLIHPESLLYENLDLDSIDAIDLLVILQEETGKSFQVEKLQHVRTVMDIVKLIQSIVQEKDGD